MDIVQRLPEDLQALVAVLGEQPEERTPVADRVAWLLAVAQVLDRAAHRGRYAEFETTRDLAGQARTRVYQLVSEQVGGVR
ncbi:hypothetical protein GCM10012275_53110 [Longimycelium tulufanense]|uniref:Uncharacterized protein n=1 Tax=Longimycelium tulufanense TaxID=907463 RepID=A0A8J3CHE7_9PSEU|nr:hypothetical protein [Longimycelium tulufanense]GGM75774.1 hypothetical protein GCM10012275_53110 [Longimycelium tulufanense]